MRSLRTNFKEYSGYVTSPACISAISVEGSKMIEKAMVAAEMMPDPGRFGENVMSITLMASALGVGIGNVYMNDHSSKNVTHAMRAMMAGVVASITTEHMAWSPYITAFTSAAAGLIMRRHISLDEKPDSPGNGPR